MRTRDKNLLQDHSSNIQTSTAGHVHELDRAARMTRETRGASGIKQ